MIDFSMLQGLTIPEGVVTQIADASGRVLWAVQSGDKVILEVEKITSDTYAGETTYTGEQFILLDIYPKTNGTVKVTYGGLTKTITDTSGAAEPNAQQVFFGTFNGVSDSVATPASGEVIIEGDCTGFGIGTYGYSSKYEYTCNCVKKILEFGQVTDIPNNAFKESVLSGAIGLTGELILPSQIKSIGDNAFCFCTGLTSVSISENLIRVGGLAFGDCMKLKTVTMHGATPPELVISVFANGENAGKEHFGNFGDPIYYPESMYVEKIIVPKGCGNVYKSATGWSVYADYIVEAT